MPTSRVLVPVPVHINGEFCSKRCAYLWEKIITWQNEPPSYTCCLRGTAFEHDIVYTHPGTDKPLRTAWCRRLTREKRS